MMRRPNPKKSFSVNVSPKESQLAYVDAPEAMKLWQVNNPAQSSKFAGSAHLTKVGLALYLAKAVLGWMVLGALVALMLETLMGGEEIAN